MTQSDPQVPCLAAADPFQGLHKMSTTAGAASAEYVAINPLAIATAVRFCKITPAEAIAAGTVNAAALLGYNDRGRIEPGLRADLILLRHKDERQLAYELGGNPVDTVICGGAVVR